MMPFILFRVDASLEIGTGHVMRCLTLADALTLKGADCQFICRAHEGNLIEFIRSKGYVAHALPIAHEASEGSNETGPDAPTNPAHSHWLGTTQAHDVEVCAPILGAQRPDWLIVDHYGLDIYWEHALAPYYHALMVIDDLADRRHACKLLLDQTFGRDAADYRPLVPRDCQLLCGSQYALLRPEFAALRAYSLQRRSSPALRELLITLGGVDKDNVTGLVLEALRMCPLPADCQITVVMGTTAPWLDDIRKQAQDMPWPTRLLVGVSDMAQLMADSDLAIGAAGATSWERCCMGLPTIMIVLAENQKLIARAMAVVRAAVVVDVDYLLQQLPNVLSHHGDEASLRIMSTAARNVCIGRGAKSVVSLMLKEVHEDHVVVQ